VLSATPGPGGQAAVGSAVDLVLASGEVVVPDVVGLGPLAARTLLEGTGLVVTERETTRVGGVLVDAPVRTVSGTMPVAGERVVLGGGVVVLVDRVVPIAPVPSPTGTSPALGPEPDPSAEAAAATS
jgi:serine/threonine-protein kinase